MGFAGLALSALALLGTAGQVRAEVDVIAEYPYAPPETAGLCCSNLQLTVHYEMYEGIPVLSKSFTLENGAGEPVRVEEIETEILAVPQDQIGNVHAESDYSFHLANHAPNDCHAVGGATNPTDR